MELFVLFAVSLGYLARFRSGQHFLGRKREKAMIDAIESLNHRLIQLENKPKEIP